MNKVKKMLLVSALALSVVSTCSATPMAMGLRCGNSYEKAAEQYARSIEDLVERTGDAYEDVTESYPDNAKNNPNAPAEYLQTVVKLGNNYLSNLFGLTKSFLGK